ncbi:MAG: alpha/beta fold hydrolase [Bacteroidota bacterium]
MKTLITRTLGTGLNTLAWVAPDLAAEKGFRLFCRPLRSKLTAQHHAFFNTAQRHSLRHQGEDITVYKWGNGETKILFVHGWQSHTYRWKKYVEQLNADRFTVYALDGPGHGLSSGHFMTVPLYSEVLVKLMQTTGAFHAVVGHSIGAFTSLYTFYKHQHLSPKQLVMLAPPAEAREFFEFYGSQLRLTPRTMQLVRNRFVKEVGQEPEYFSAPAFAAGVGSHGLLIHDEEDDETPVENSKKIHESWKGSRLMITRGIGHNLKSKEVVQAVVDFVSHQDAHFERETVHTGSLR